MLSSAAQLPRCNQVYNTGRSLGQFVSLMEEKAGGLALPNVLITAVGTKARLSIVLQLSPSFNDTFTHTL